MSSRLVFAAEPDPLQRAGPVTLQVLVVDDDPEVHAVTRLMLDSFQFEGHRVGLLHAHSAAEAKPLLCAHPNIGLVLLDVVMETDRSGLDLVRTIREELGNRSTRIALRTGQPGLVPELQIVSQYSIDDYVVKSDLTFLRVQTLVTSALRTFLLLRQLEAAQADLQHANVELERLAQTDPLTGLWNRRRFEVEIEREWRRMARDRLPAAALMIDVDYFKAYNDSEGHPAGDRVLQQIAKVLSDTFRRGGDAVCRYGGEEFFVLLPGMTPAEAQAAGERTRRLVEELGIHHGHSPHRVVTISVGCVSAQPDSQAGPSGYMQLIESADQAMYRAKQAGRNRVECACQTS